MALIKETDALYNGSQISLWDNSVIKTFISFWKTKRDVWYKDSIK